MPWGAANTRFGSEQPANVEIILEIKEAVWEEEMTFHGSCVNFDATTLCVHRYTFYKKTHCFFFPSRKERLSSD